jgi:hypothetical protein
MVMETDGDGSGGTSPSRQGARTETFVPQNSSAVATKLRNSFGNFADYFRVFRPKAFYRRKGMHRQRWTRVVSPPGGAARGWPTPPYGELALWPPSDSLSVLILRLRKIGVSVVVSSNSENISCVAFLKHKNSRK